MKQNFLFIKRSVDISVIKSVRNQIINVSPSEQIKFRLFRPNFLLFLWFCDHCPDYHATVALSRPNIFGHMTPLCNPSQSDQSWLGSKTLTWMVSSENQNWLGTQTSFWRTIFCLFSKKRITAIHLKLRRPSQFYLNISTLLNSRAKNNCFFPEINTKRYNSLWVYCFFLLECLAINNLFLIVNFLNEKNPLYIPYLVLNATRGFVVAFMAYERYLAVCSPFQYKSVLSDGRRRLVGDLLTSYYLIFWCLFQWIYPTRGEVSVRVKLFSTSQGQDLISILVHYSTKCTECDPSNQEIKALYALKLTRKSLKILR